MKVEVTYSCGHTGTIDVYGDKANRQRMIWAAEHKDCPDCCKAKMAAETAKAAAETADLAPLTGSEKQISWATTIRAGIIAKVNEYMDMVAAESAKMEDREYAEAGVAEAKKFEAWIKGKTSASWWIDHRNTTDINNYYAEMIGAN